MLERIVVQSKYTSGRLSVPSSVHRDVRPVRVMLLKPIDNEAVAVGILSSLWMALHSSQDSPCHLCIKFPLKLKHMRTGANGDVHAVYTVPWADYVDGGQMIPGAHMAYMRMHCSLLYLDLSSDTQPVRELPASWRFCVEFECDSGDESGLANAVNVEFKCPEIIKRRLLDTGEIANCEMYGRHGFHFPKVREVTWHAQQCDIATVANEVRYDGERGALAASSLRSCWSDIYKVQLLPRIADVFESVCPQSRFGRPVVTVAEYVYGLSTMDGVDHAASTVRFADKDNCYMHMPLFDAGPTANTGTVDKHWIVMWKRNIIKYKHGMFAVAYLM